MIVVGLTYFPVLALGPIVEHLAPVGAADDHDSHVPNPPPADRAPHDAHRRSAPLFDPAIVAPAIVDSFVKLDPAHAWRATR